MNGERLTLQIGEPKTNNPQRLSLVGPQEKVVATLDLFPSSDRGTYYAYWPSDLTGEELALLTEECLTHYEEAYRNGVKIVGGGVVDPAGRDLKANSLYEVGMIVYSNNEGEGWVGGSEELPLQRPVNWQQIVEAAQGNKIGFVKINTPIGGFCIHPNSRTDRNFGVMSHIVEPDGFVDMLTKSVKRDVTQEEAENLFSQALLKLQG